MWFIFDVCYIIEGPFGFVGRGTEGAPPPKVVVVMGWFYFCLLMIESGIGSVWFEFRLVEEVRLVSLGFGSHHRRWWWCRLVLF